MELLDHKLNLIKGSPEYGTDISDLTIVKETYYQLNTKYAITINPCDEFQFLKKETLILREIRCREYMLNTIQEINHLNRGLNIYLISEISENYYNPRYQTKESRFHWHGMIEFTTPESLKHFLLIDVCRLSKECQLNIVKIDEMEGWKQYVHKSQFYMKSKAITNNTKFSNLCRQGETGKE